MSLVFTFILTISAILLNIYLIPILGMNGSALSNLLSYILYFSLLLSLVKWKTGTSPFSWAQLKVVVIITSIFLLNIAWIHTIYPLFAKLPLRPLTYHLIDGIVKTLILGGLSIAAIYFWKVSEEVNTLAGKVIEKFRIFAD